MNKRTHKLTTMAMAALCLGAMLPTHTHAAIIFTSGSTDTYIHSDTDNDLSAFEIQALATDSSARRSMLYYDLSSFSGQTVSGDGTLHLFTQSGSGFGAATMNVVLMTQNANAAKDEWWGPDAVTSNPATPNWTDFNGDFGGVIGSVALAANLALNTEVTVAIPQATLQSWIDFAGDNWGIGLMLSNESVASTVGSTFYSGDTAPTGSEPYLEFSVIPEPASVVLMGLGAVALLVRRRKS